MAERFAESHPDEQQTHPRLENEGAIRTERNGDAKGLSVESHR
mgnify:CR=1 FL=1